MFVFSLAEKQKLKSCPSSWQRALRSAAGPRPSPAGERRPEATGPAAAGSGDTHRGRRRSRPAPPGDGWLNTPPASGGAVFIIYSFFYYCYYYQSCDDSSIRVKYIYIYFCNGWLRNITAQFCEHCCYVLWLDG